MFISKIGIELSRKMIISPSEDLVGQDLETMYDKIVEHGFNLVLQDKMPLHDGIELSKLRDVLKNF